MAAGRENKTADGIAKGGQAAAQGLTAADSATAPASAGRRRVVIEGIFPVVDGGRFPIKRCVGERVVVEADIFVDGHDELRCLLLHRRQGAPAWQSCDMEPLGNDRWRARFEVTKPGFHEYTVTAWADPAASWRHDLERWTAAEDIAVALAAGAQLIGAIAARAEGEDARRLRDWAAALAGPQTDASGLERRRALGLDAALHALAAEYADRSHATTAEPVLRVFAEPELARFSAWYEMFPRSAGGGKRHGTFRDCKARLPYIADMGFDVLYLPPIHPIGTTKRKGANNALAAKPGEPGSPWAIGSGQGGHKAIHPELGTPEDFRSLVQAARARGIEVALDIAFQCSPDHPYVKERPEWFRHRPDGSVQFAENPPKKYEDIYPFDFDTAAWRELWAELKSIFDHWMAQGVRVFRVDNPHTKPFPMWEWIIGEIRKARPDVIFLSEAFTRPRPMHRLAKIGFTQSYTYFPWRNHKAELVEYFTELSQSPSREYFRPNAWPNTPDILTETLQHGGRAAFMSRLVLAATLSANYGIYGPAFELGENVARNPGSEEYLNSEKYEIRDWKLNGPAAQSLSLAKLIARINRIRRDNPALQHDWRLRFHATDNDQLICYSKSTEDFSNVVLTVVNLHPRHTHSGWTDLDLAELGLAPGGGPYVVHDLLTDARYTWQGARNYVALAPGALPAHILRVERRPS